MSKQSQAKTESIVTAAELAGAQAERRLYLRWIAGYPRPMTRSLRSLQNELAFRKEFIQRYGGALSNDPPAQAIRAAIGRLRSG